MRKLDISIQKITKCGYKVIVSTEDFTEIQAIHYNQPLLVIRYETTGTYARRIPRNYSMTDKKVMKAVYEEWEKIPDSSEFTQIK